MDSELYDQIDKEAWKITNVISEKVIHNLQNFVRDKGLPDSLLQHLIVIVKGSVAEGYEKVHPAFMKALHELVPANNLPLLMERIPRRRHP